MLISDHLSTVLLSRVGIKRLLVTTLLILLLTMPLEFIHVMAVILHTLYETLAFACEHALIHGVGLSKFHAQLIVFYSTLLVGLWLVIVVWRRLPSVLRAIGQQCCLSCRQYHANWQQRGIWRKLELILLQCAGLLGLLLMLS